MRSQQRRQPRDRSRPSRRQTQTHAKARQQSDQFMPPSNRKRIGLGQVGPLPLLAMQRADELTAEQRVWPEKSFQTKHPYHMDVGEHSPRRNPDCCKRVGRPWEEKEIKHAGDHRRTPSSTVGTGPVGTGPVGGGPSSSKTNPRGSSRRQPWRKTCSGVNRTRSNLRNST